MRRQSLDGRSGSRSGDVCDTILVSWAAGHFRRVRAGTPLCPVRPMRFETGQLSAADGLLASRPLTGLLVVRCAFSWVLSIIMVAPSGPAAPTP